MRSDGFELNDVIGGSIGRLPTEGRPSGEGPAAAGSADEWVELWGDEPAGEIPLVCAGYLPPKIQRELALRVCRL